MPKQALGEMATVKSTGKRRRTASVTGINGIIKPQKGVKQKQQKPIQLKSKALANLQEERERLLHELHLNEERQQKLTLKNDAYMGQAADGSASKKGKKGKRGIDGKAAVTMLQLFLFQNNIAIVQLPCIPHCHSLSRKRGPRDNGVL